MKKEIPKEHESLALELMEGFRTNLEQQIGAPKLDYRIAKFFQADYGPTFAVEGADVNVIVGPNAFRNEATFLANLAHESVHIHLTEGLEGWASGMEEGFALTFELSMIESRYGISMRELFENHLPNSYKTALRDFHYLEKQYPDPAKITLNEFGRLTGPSIVQFKSLFPQIGWLMCYRLARRKRMR